ncbi:hypothetical protein LTR85_012053 [Meristemomyces frigidus]|nr:hypothetical protein LTR85_012053 [Meristemomyces frigidus]
MSAAASAVFDTFELLESILAHLPTADLARSRRLSSHFRDVIDRSHQLQQKLFLTPTSSTAWLQWHSPETGDWETSITNDATKAEEPHTYPIVTLHPALDDGRIPDRRTKFWTTLDLNRMRLWSTSGTWREMHVTQPPSLNITLHYRAHDAQMFRLPIEATGSVRLGDIIDETHNLMQSGGALTERRRHHRCRLRCYARPVIHREITIAIEGCVLNRSEWVARALGMDVPTAATEEPLKLWSKPKFDKTSWLSAGDFA